MTSGASPASLRSLRAKGDATTRPLPDETTDATTATAADAATGGDGGGDGDGDVAVAFAVDGGDGGGADDDEGARVYDAKAATSLASSTVIIIGWPTFTYEVNDR